MSDRANLHLLSATDAARLIREGAISAEGLIEACLMRAREAAAGGRAWAFLDPDHALAQARAADARRLEGQPIGPLHGVPVAIEDLFDTADMPTEHGSVLHAGRMPSRDATVVAMLRAAGALIMGKTATTELGADDGGDRHGLERGRRGRSGRSAAAVAAGMVPLALGSQTNGSTIRSAASCGVLGFKPTHGLIPRHGMLTRSRTLDHVGLFARTIDDVALLAAQLVGYDERDPDTRPRARIPFMEVAADEPPLPPMLAFVKTPHWQRADEETRDAFAQLVEHLGDRVEEVELSPPAAEAWQWHRTIMEAEMAANLEREWDEGRGRLSESLRAQLEHGREVAALDYQRALTRIRPMYESFVELFEQRYDAILTPAAPGIAPGGVASPTGDAVFCTLWTLCGMPAVSLPLLQGTDAVAIGVQLVGPREGDARLLRTARWLSARVAGG
jgi:Asp-tRNA(Asn)/Glu-tRNA(Gln) amidotransferase A subunit family amidase